MNDRNGGDATMRCDTYSFLLLARALSSRRGLLLAWATCLTRWMIGAGGGKRRAGLERWRDGETERRREGGAATSLCPSVSLSLHLFLSPVRELATSAPTLMMLTSKGKRRTWPMPRRHKLTSV